MVEVLVAITVLLLATAGPMTIAARSLQHAQFSAQQNVGFFLAQEGVEAVYKIRADAGLAHIDNPSGNDAWDWINEANLADCLAPNQCGIDWQDEDVLNNVISCNDAENCRLYFDETANRARYSHDNAGESTLYTRVITIEDLTSTEARIRSVVTWKPPNTNETRSVTMESYLHDIYDTNY